MSFTNLTNDEHTWISWRFEGFVTYNYIGFKGRSKTILIQLRKKEKRRDLYVLNNASKGDDSLWQLYK
jgi:hypothetical protein